MYYYCGATHILSYKIFNFSSSFLCRFRRKYPHLKGALATGIAIIPMTLTVSGAAILIT